MYGAGNIGRGFIGALLSQNGYRVTFVDVAKPVVEALHTRGSYPLRTLVGTGHTDETIQNVDAIDGNDTDAVAEAIANADVMATAVGANILKFIAPNIAAGLKRRRAERGTPLNIIICENLLDANKVLERLIKEKLTKEDCDWMDQNVGLVEASIGRMVPVQTPAMQDGDALRVCVERYGYLPVDKDAFRGGIPQIERMVPFSPFDFYIRRKLFVHNMGHATCAYLGLYAGKEFIYESIDDAETYAIVLNAMLESAEALSKTYGVPLGDILLHIQDLLQRFTNAGLKDTCKRVGNDPVRKLSANDRLAGASTFCRAAGGMPTYICVGAAGALFEYLRQSELPQTRENAEAALESLSGIDEKSDLQEPILAFYDMFATGRSIAYIRRAAQKRKAEANLNVI